MKNENKSVSSDPSKTHIAYITYKGCPISIENLEKLADLSGVTNKEFKEFEEFLNKISREEVNNGN